MEPIPILATRLVHFGISTGHRPILESAFLHTVWVSPQMMIAIETQYFQRENLEGARNINSKAKIHGIQPSKYPSMWHAMKL